MGKKFFLLFAVSLPLAGQVSVLTYHNDNARTGQNNLETALLPGTVNSTNFGKLFTQAVDGLVYAQPLYAPNVGIPSLGVHNVVYVATEHDSVYAFDADSNLGSNATPLWHTSFLGSGVTTVPSADVGCGQIVPELGITATPVIDPVAGTIYVVAMTKEVSGATTKYVQRLHALSMTTGLERQGSPVIVQATVPGTGEGGTTVTFNPKNYKARPGLLLMNGTVYTFWSSHCDIGTYHGWVMAYNASTLAQTAVYNTTPNGNEASLWNSGAGPAADSQNNIYVSTGNGSFNADQNGGNYGDSFVKLSTGGGSLSVADYFAPLNQANLASTDADLGSGGVLVLPDGLGPTGHPNLLVGAGKEGKIYSVDRQNMGHFSASKDNVVQEIASAIGASFGMPAFFNNSIYYGGSGDKLKQFTLSGGMLSTSAASSSAGTFSYPGTTPSVSSYGPTNGLVWAIDSAAALHAYSASNLAQELYNSASTAGRDDLGSYVKYSVPTVANGKVYVGTQNTIAVFGLLPGLNSAVSPASGSGSSGTFQFTFSDPSGATNLTWEEVLVNDTLSGVNGCWIIYYRPNNVFYLYSDALDTAYGPLTPGSAGTAQNSYCSVDAGASSVSASGTTLVLNLALTFKSAFTGARNFYLLSYDNAGHNSGWVDRGDWTVTGSAPPPTADSLAPPSGSGSSATFSAVYSDAAGVANLEWGELLINGSLVASNGCWIVYNRPSNVFYLFNDAGTGPAGGPLAPGAAGTLQNSQCALDLSHSSVSQTATSMTVNMAVSFKTGFSGAKNRYIVAVDTGGQVSPWELKGTWTTP